MVKRIHITLCRDTTEHADGHSIVPICVYTTRTSCYDDEMAAVDEARIVLRAQETLQSSQNVKVIDLGCGEGVLLCELLERHAAWVGLGVELDASLVHRARQQAEQRGLAARLTFQEGDMLREDLQLRSKEVRRGIHDACAVLSTIQTRYGRDSMLCSCTCSHQRLSS